MIPDEYIKQLFSNGNELLREHLDPDEVLPTQFIRGVNPFQIECMRHMTVFTRFNAIPRLCFDCYKVTIELQTVMELFKLMIIFENLKLPDDNARKCMVECREQIPGSYKGFIYCSNTEQGELIKNWIHKVVSEEISDNIQVTLKRGCSEYALSYPEYAKMGHDKPAMQYNEDWQQYEDLVDKDFNFEPQPATFNQPSYNFHDAKVMLGWLKYAATIGDQSYLNISSEPLSRWENLNRPARFPFR